MSARKQPEPPPEAEMTPCGCGHAKSNHVAATRWVEASCREYACSCDGYLRKGSVAYLTREGVRLEDEARRLADASKDLLERVTAYLALVKGRK